MKSKFLFFFISIIILKYIQSDNNKTNYSIEINNNNDTSLNIIIDENSQENIININETQDIDGTIFSMQTSKDFDLNIKINGTSKNTLIILFYSHGCGHCIRFQPDYKKISEILKNNTNLKFSKIETKIYLDVLKKYKQISIQYIPKIYVYKNGNFIGFSEERKIEQIISFINRIHNFECNELISISELNKYINYKTIFSLDKENHFILGIFKNNQNNKLDKSFIINNFFELNTLNNEIVQNKNCYYFYYNENIGKKDDLNESNFYLNNILSNEDDNDKDNEKNNNLIYAYNYQRGLSTFSLFDSYLNFQNNSTQLNDYININKHIKIIQSKYKKFISNNYLYKYYYINNDEKLDKFENHNKNYFLFKFKTDKTYKLFISEINYILYLNSSLIDDYLFILVNISLSKKYFEHERIAFFNKHDFYPIEILRANELNKTNIENTIFEYIYRDQNNLLELQLDVTEKLIKSAKQWFLNLGKKKNETNDTIFNSENIEKKIKNSQIDIEQELIDEINKTIIEDKKAKNIEKDKKGNNENKKKKIEKNIQKYRRANSFEYKEEDEFGFNKKLIMFPFYLIIYSILYYFFYKYILMKYENKILYNRLPTEEPKSK